jgi:hypothetical protein
VKVTAPLVPGRTSFACIHDTKSRHIYAIGGNTAGQNTLDDIQRFDIFSQTWELLPKMPTPRANCSSAIKGAYLYLFGGFRAYGGAGLEECRSIERLHIETLQWEVVLEENYTFKACNFLY